MEPKYIIWECKCGKTYALEPKQVKVHSCKQCGILFPNQEQRDRMFKEQFGVMG